MTAPHTSSASSVYSELRRLLEQTIAYVEKSDVEVYSSQSSDELKRELSRHVDELKAGRLRNTDELSYLFGPTNNLQELSLDNNWGVAFVEIAGQIDRLIEEIKSLPSQPK